MATTLAPLGQRTRRVRIFCLIVAVVTCAMIAVSSKRVCRAVWQSGSGSEYSATLERGLLVLGRLHRTRAGPSPSIPGPGPHFRVERNWGDEVSLAWRPYHIAQQGFPFGANLNALALPLWLIALPAVVAAAYTQGLIVGTRRADKGRCAKCGYSRAGLATGTPCPECGTV